MPQDQYNIVKFKNKINKKNNNNVPQDRVRYSRRLCVPNLAELAAKYFGILFMCASGSERQWHPTPVLLPGKSHERRNLVRFSP